MAERNASTAAEATSTTSGRRVTKATSEPQDNPRGATQHERTLSPPPTHKTQSFQDHHLFPKRNALKSSENLRLSFPMASIGVKPDNLRDYLVTRAQQRTLVITCFGKTYSPPEGTIFRQDSSKRESKQQVSTLSRKSSSSERTVFERPNSKEGSFPAFEALFRKYGSALPAAIRRLQGDYYRKGSITEHAF